MFDFEGLIIVAEDQKVNLDALQMNINAIGLDKKCEYCIDGRETLEVAKQILEEALLKPSDERVRPIAMMLLDLQMPYKSGIEVVKEIQKFYAKHKDRLVEPLYVFLTAFATPNFKNYVTSLGVNHCFEKPLSEDHLLFLTE